MDETMDVMQDMAGDSVAAPKARPRAPKAKPRNGASRPGSNSSSNSRQHGLSDAISRSQAVIEFGLDGIVLNANANFLAALGYGLEEIKGQHHTMMLDPTYRQSPEYRTFWDKLTRGEQQSGRYKLIGRGDKEVWWQASYAPARNGQGKPTHIIAVGLDVTDLAQKAAADEAELKLRTDIMNMTSIVSYADLKGTILSVNEKFVEVSKYPKDELIGWGHNRTRHPDMPKEVFKELWSTIGRGRPFRGVIKNLAKDGTPYYVDAVVAPIMGNNGKPKGYLGVRYDITEAELERHNMRGLFAAINESYAYIEFDTSGNIITANQIFIGLMGYSLAEITGKHHRMFVEPAYSVTPGYAQFWADLGAGKACS
ncbi:MAG TPA: PAS domain S-box protein, partial [Bradyrhizobium sp.]|nr:PAS domain S-box protein [Bradyrhizobium sp.]